MKNGTYQEEKQRKADVLAKDLYGENARVLKYLQVKPKLFQTY